MLATKNYSNHVINEIDLYYERYTHSSTAETIVLLHGFLSSSFSFRKLVPLLSKEYNVISVDLPPFGKSGKSPKFVYSYENIAKTVIQFIEELNLGKVHLIGHSMGGQISLNVNYQRPDLIHKTILLCSSSYLKKSKFPLIMSSYIPFFHHYVKFHLAKSGVKKNLQTVVYDQSLIDDELMYGYLQPFLEDDIFRALTRMIRDREGDLSEKQLAMIETPSLLIWGEHDRVVPLQVGKRLHQDLPNAELIVLKETGHLVPEERPDEVFQHIKQFIS